MLIALLLFAVLLVQMFGDFLECGRVVVALGGDLFGGGFSLFAGLGAGAGTARLALAGLLFLARLPGR